jgi:ribosome-associated heat shock protein Hsp15
MRLDLFLVASRLIKRRTLAQEFCDKGLVKVNGSVSKPAKEIKKKDEIEIRRRNESVRVRVLKVPETKQISKVDASSLFEIISTTPID